MNRILYLDTTPDVPMKDVITTVSKHYGYEVDYHDYANKESFEAKIQHSTEPYQILYFASHGNPNGVQCNSINRDAINGYSWPELGALFCASDGLNENSTIILASCDAGFKRGALTLMANCNKINTVAGLPCEMKIANEAIIYHTFLHCLCNNRSSNQIEAAVESASGQSFRVFKRYEMDVEIMLFANMISELCFVHTPEDETAN